VTFLLKRLVEAAAVLLNTRHDFHCHRVTEN
jgi:hypothetical protein